MGLAALLAAAQSCCSGGACVYIMGWQLLLLHLLTCQVVHVCASWGWQLLLLHPPHRRAASPEATWFSPVLMLAGVMGLG